RLPPTTLHAVLSFLRPGPALLLRRQPPRALRPAPRRPSIVPLPVRRPSRAGSRLQAPLPPLLPPLQPPKLRQLARALRQLLPPTPGSTSCRVPTRQLAPRG